MDLVGVVLTTGGVLGLVWALVRGNDAGWLSAETLGALAAGVVLTVAFVLWELRTPAPMVPMRFFTHRAFSAGNVASFAHDRRDVRASCTSWRSTTRPSCTMARSARGSE